MSDYEAVRDHLNAAYQYARKLNKPMLSYLIEMAVLESNDTELAMNSDPATGRPESRQRHSPSTASG